MVGVQTLSKLASSLAKVDCGFVSVSCGTMSDAMHSILEHVEGLDLPEGEYLRLTNMLKEVHERMAKPAAPVIPPTPLDYVMGMYGRGDNAEFKISSRLPLQMEGPFAYHHRYVMTVARNGTILNTVTDTAANLRTVMRIFSSLVIPKHVGYRMKSHGVSVEYTHDLLDINRARIAEDKLLCHQHHGTDGSTFCEDCQEEEDNYDLSPESLCNRAISRFWTMVGER
jgi:hypothetical protein